MVSQKAEPRNRSEQEIAGYREVLSTIHEGYEYINPRPNIILQLHRDLYSYSQGSAGGSYKNSDNVIAETDAEGHQKTRFIPVPAFQTAEAWKNFALASLKHRSLSKPDRIKAVIDNKVGKITKKEIMELCPNISKITVERTLTNLVKSGYIAKVGAGPSTGYVRV